MRRLFPLIISGLLLFSGASAHGQMAPGTVRARLYDSSGNSIGSATAAPAGTERGLITRNIPNGTQTVSDPTVSTGATVSSVSVTSSTAGTQIVASITTGLFVTVPSDAAVAVYCALYDGAASSLTARRGVRITPGNGYAFIARSSGWSGQVVGILESGSTAVSVEVNTW